MEVLQHLRIDRNSSVPLESQLARQLERLIASDALGIGYRLPPIRDLASQIGLNLHTVRAAYRRLETQGLVEMRQGHGTTVVARGLAGFASGRTAHRSFTIGVVLPAMAMFYEPVLAGMHEAALNDPSRVLIAFADERLDAAESYVRHFATDADGIIVVSQTLAEPLELDAPDLPPMVFADWPGSPEPAILFSPSPLGDVVRHLVEHGHDTIALVTPPAHHPNVSPLVAEYRKAVIRFGLSLVDEPVEVPGWTSEEGRIAMTRILESDTPPTAVMCANDPLAIGAIQAARSHGLHVGRDIAITGFGEIELSELVIPGLTTVRLPARHLGQLAMRRLLDQIEDKPVEPLTELTGHLVIRGSCGCDEADH